MRRKTWLASSCLVASCSCFLRLTPPCTLHPAPCTLTLHPAPCILENLGSLELLGGIVQLLLEARVLLVRAQRLLLHLVHLR